MKGIHDVWAHNCIKKDTVVHLMHPKKRWCVLCLDLQCGGQGPIVPGQWGTPLIHGGRTKGCQCHLGQHSAVLSCTLYRLQCIIVTSFIYFKVCVLSIDQCRNAKRTVKTAKCTAAIFWSCHKKNQTGQTPLITDPPPTSFTTLSEKRKRKNYM